MKNEFEKKKILVVDDDAVFQDLAKLILSKKYDVATSKSGKDALILLLTNKPDLILLDIIMPEMDGWETFHKIRGTSLLQNVPIAFITSLSETEGLENAQSLGAIEYFTKPIERTDFLNRIEKIFSGGINEQSFPGF